MISLIRLFMHSRTVRHNHIVSSALSAPFSSYSSCVSAIWHCKGYLSMRGWRMRWRHGGYVVATLRPPWLVFVAWRMMGWPKFLYPPGGVFERSSGSSVFASLSPAGAKDTIRFCSIAFFSILSVSALLQQFTAFASAQQSWA